MRTSAQLELALTTKTGDEIFCTHSISSRSLYRLHLGYSHLKDTLQVTVLLSNLAPHIDNLKWLNERGPRANTLQWSYLNDHVCAFTHFEEVMIFECGILCWPSVVVSLAPLGSSLVRLRIDLEKTTHKIIIPLLAALPRLRMEVSGDRDTTRLPPLGSASCGSRSRLSSTTRDV